MDSRKISLLLPSAYRSRSLREAIEAALNSTDMPLEICVSIVNDDPESAIAVRDFPIVLDVRSVAEYGRGAVYAWNKLFQRSTGDIVALWADDLRPEHGWLTHALDALDKIGGHGLVGLNDLSSDGNEYAAHWLADRAFIENELGGVMYPPQYHGWWADREVTDIAKALGCYRWARRALVEHLNYSFGKSKFDRTYRDAAQHYDADRQTYIQRKANGFAHDWNDHESAAVLSAESETASPVAQNRRKHPKTSVD